MDTFFLIRNKIKKSLFRLNYLHIDSGNLTVKLTTGLSDCSSSKCQCRLVKPSVISLVSSSVHLYFLPLPFCFSFLVVHIFCSPFQYRLQYLYLLLLCQRSIEQQCSQKRQGSKMSKANGNLRKMFKLQVKLVVPPAGQVV